MRTCRDDTRATEFSATTPVGDVPRADGVGGAYRKAAPYVAACNSLVGSVAGCTFLGYGLDRWMGHSVLWLLVVGAIFGIVVGFVSFFFQIARVGRTTQTRTRAAPSPAAP